MVAGVAERSAVRPLGVKNPCDVPHFAAGPDGLAVEMDGCSGHREQLRILVDHTSDQVDHLDLAVTNGMAQRPSGDRPDVLLELRDRCSVDGPVSGIVHPRCDLVHQQCGAGSGWHHKHFDCKHADIIERCRDALGDRSRVRIYQI